MDMVLWEGVLFAALLLGFLAVHEFGHYFAAVRHGIGLPCPTSSRSPSRPSAPSGRSSASAARSKQPAHVRCGASGPIAGFIAALLILLYGFATLPEPEYMQNFAGHERLNYYIETHGSFPEYPISDINTRDPDVMVLGNTLLFSILASFLR
jgi:hypothetical protein